MDFDEEKHIIEDDENFMPLEVLMNEFNCLTQDNHQLWYLYKQFNLKYFDDEEKQFLDDTVERLRKKALAIATKNISKLQVADLGSPDIL
tara:strand:- start:8068 stop:8337 length:270 start_codon:yes stop_codon:yes gene_type:complete